MADTLLRSELAVMFRRRRHLAVLAVLAAVPVLIAVAVRLSDPVGAGEGPPFLDRVTQNGLFVGITALVICVPLFLPLAVGVVSGDAVAGEASHGTLRYLLVAPAGRTRLLVVKLLGVVAFCLAATLTVVLSGAAIGLALFGAQDVAVLSGGTITPVESIGRALLAAGYVTVSLVGLGTVGVFVSTLTDVPVGAMAATVTVAVVAQVVGQIPQVDWIHPWLLTYRWFDVADVLRDPVAWESFRLNALLQAGYVAVFGTLAWARLTSKDVLS
ncbi:ABC transporter permease [Aquipuribacter nitratireducens]|uniref:ABC transporter permease n=1 Tax=Aquipuribacter nitratireducens TaxID=650104 RepID=A0ABW0GN10_9MICO